MFTTITTPFQLAGAAVVAAAFTFEMLTAVPAQALFTVSAVWLSFT